MSPSSRRVALALAVTTALSIIVAALLIGGLGGNWLAFVALAVAFCVLCLAAFLLLAFGPAAMVAAADAADDVTEDDPWESDAAQGLERLIVTGRIDDVYGDRDRWAS